MQSIEMTRRLVYTVGGSGGHEATACSSKNSSLGSESPFLDTPLSHSQ